ncbi:hypothetical protein PMI35_01432 [Pseudomonas sp. GM78]|nr:hypothetical protein PMI35_01432 [Pseudomonas sp. GM78]
MLAMVVNDNAGRLTPRDTLRFIASMLAPTNPHLRFNPPFLHAFRKRLIYA